MTDKLIRWIDANLIWLGVVFLLTGLALTGLDSLRNTLGISVIGGTGSGSYVVSWGMAVTVLSSFAQALVYNSVWMIAVGVLLGHWRVTIVGFEDAQTDDLTVEGPDDENRVWIGRRYASEGEARLAFDVLSKRIRPLH